MYLANLLTARGVTMSTLGVAMDVAPRLFDTIDRGLQPMPKFLATRVANFLRVPLWQVVAACPLNTDLTSPVLLHPLPPDQDELFSPARIAPTVPSP